MTGVNGRKCVRAATNHLAGLEWRRGKISVRVVDISMTGTRLATHEQIPMGEPVVVTTMRMGTRPGVVIRFSDGELGIRFTDEIAGAYETQAR